MDEHVLASSNPDYIRNLQKKTRKISAIAVLSGVCGAVISHMLSALPPPSSSFLYEFVTGAEKVAFYPSISVIKDVTMRSFNRSSIKTEE